MAELLPYQTRSYEAERKARAKKLREQVANEFSGGKKTYHSR
jgi:hypothetical protein